MKEKLIVVFLMAITNVAFLKTIEQKEEDYSSMLIYGKVTTLSDQEYVGQIRWGDEEAFWFDFFNSQKPENNNLDYLTKKEIEYLNDKDDYAHNGKWWNWGNSYNNNNHEHVFACQFGDIKSLDINGSKKVILELKNGDRIKLKGGSNDIGADIEVHDDELGHITLDWKRVSKVEFMTAPKGMRSYYGNPLYGKVHTRGGDFTGYVQWDHDERLGHDELNGDNRDGEMDIEFAKIASIKKDYGGSIVTLFSGREFELRGSNDVDDDNRGIIVNNPEYGRVDIDWDEFNKVEFYADAPVAEKSYTDFTGEKLLFGTVITRDGETYRGSLVYDLDEAYQLEMLNGMHDEIEYFIPFSHVKTISPLNRGESKVELTSGRKLVLDDKVDVDENNDGVLVFKSEDEYNYIMWEDIDQIRLDN